MSKADISATARCGGGVMRVSVARQLIFSRRGFAAIGVAILTSGPICAQEAVPICHARPVNVRLATKSPIASADTAGAAGASLCLYQGPTTVHLEVRQTSIAAILSALASAYKISYRSSVPLTEIRSGKYTGRVQTLIADVLDGYDYAIKHENSAIAVTVFNKSGGQPVAAAQPAPVPVASEAERAAVATPAKKTRGEITVSRSH
jgi:hypothetical protein